ncbi:MAG: succinyl-diaminopimelate desuccinylase [Thermoprotei archaeon]|nr:MAG: succinyl-diaminopimelate desuccinylase [Thermoprotei archaeon]
MSYPVEKAIRKIDSLKEDTIRILMKLIEIPTVNPPGEHYAEIASYLKESLTEVGIDTRVIKVPRDVVAKYYREYADYERYIVIARIKSGEGPIFHLNGHYDVVPPGQGWSFDPFKPIVRDDKVYGRGASDMKGGIASIITSLLALAEVEGAFSGIVEASFTPDEEIGGRTGVDYMLEAGITKPDYAIVAEPSGLNNVWIGNKGAVWAVVEVIGKQAHGSTPWLGTNAFEKMVELAYLMIKELKPKIESKKSKYPYEDPRGAMATINIGGKVEGGAKINIVPGFYSFTIDRRVIPEETADEAERELLEFIEYAKKKIPDLNVRLKILSKSDACVTKEDSQIVKAVSSSVEEIIHKKPSITVCIGGLDTRYFQTRGIQAVTYGPGIPKVAHMANEYVRISDVLTVSKVYVKTIGKLLS